MNKTVVEQTASNTSPNTAPSTSPNTASKSHYYGWSTYIFPALLLVVGCVMFIIFYHPKGSDPHTPTPTPHTPTPTPHTPTPTPHTPTPTPSPAVYNCDFVSGIVTSGECVTQPNLPANLKQLCQEFDSEKLAQDACMYKDGKNIGVTGCTINKDGYPGGGIPQCSGSDGSKCCWYETTDGGSCEIATGGVVGGYFTGQWDGDFGLVCESSPFQQQHLCLLQSDNGSCASGNNSVPTDSGFNKGCGNNGKGICCEIGATAFADTPTPGMCSCAIGYNVAAKLKKGDFGYDGC